MYIFNIAKMTFRVLQKLHFETIVTSKSAWMHLFTLKSEISNDFWPHFDFEKCLNACIYCENDISGAPKPPFWDNFDPRKALKRYYCLRKVKSGRFLTPFWPRKVPKCMYMLQKLKFWCSRVPQICVTYIHTDKPLWALYCWNNAPASRAQLRNRRVTRNDFVGPVRLHLSFLFLF